MSIDQIPGESTLHEVASEPADVATTESDTPSGPAPRRRSRRSPDSRRRLRQAALVVGVAAAAGAGGVVVGRQIKSPADAAASRAAPAASWITVPVERRQLVSTLIVSGETRFVEPTPVRIAGAVGTSGGSSQVLTRLPELNSEVTEGGVLFEVSGRPVFAMTGELPMYRQLVPGSVGPDVLQLEASLEALGFSPGVVDQTFDAGTEAALDAFYQSKGYASEGASDEQRKALDDARKAVTDAEDGLRKAQLDLSRGTSTVTPSQRLAAQQRVDQAEASTITAREQAQGNDDAAARETATATALRDNARATLTTEQAIYNAAAAPDAVNPETGEPYTASELAMLQQAINTANGELINADQALADKVATQERTAADGMAAIVSADDALALARAELNDLLKPADTSTLQEAVEAAERQVVDANDRLAALDAEVGTIVPAGEIVFLPRLPTSVTALNAQLGAAPPSDSIAQVSSTDTEIIGRVSKADAELIRTGTPVTIELRDVGIETTGVLTDIRTPTATPDFNQGGGEFGFPQPGFGDEGDTSGRLEVVVTADDTSQIRDFIGYQVRISVTVSSTDDEVLAVPVAAISVGPDGTSRVEVEVEPARGTRPGRSELIEVTVGLAAQGFAEVVPVGGASLTEGDRVIVGTDTGQRQNRRQRNTASDESAGSGG